MPGLTPIDCVCRAAAPHDTVLKRYRVAAGSARTIHDYLRPPRLPSLPRFFPHSRLFSLHDPSDPHDSAMEIATGIAPHDSAMEIATGIARGRPLTRPTRTNARAAPNSTHRHSTHHSSGTQLKSPPPVKSPVKILDARTRTQDFPKLSPYIYPPIILLISSQMRPRPRHPRCRFAVAWDPATRCESWR